MFLHFLCVVLFLCDLFMGFCLPLFTLLTCLVSDKEAYWHLFAQVGVKNCHNCTNKYESIQIYFYKYSRNSNKDTLHVRSSVSMGSQSPQTLSTYKFWFIVGNQWFNKQNFWISWRVVVKCLLHIWPKCAKAFECSCQKICLAEMLNKFWIYFFSVPADRINLIKCALGIGP